MEPCISLFQFIDLDTEVLVKRHFFLDESDYGFECLIRFVLRDTKKAKFGQTQMPSVLSLAPEALTFSTNIITAGTVKPMPNALPTS
jgi:hypothetical protein